MPSLLVLHNTEWSEIKITDQILQGFEGNPICCLNQQPAWEKVQNVVGK